MAVVLRCGVTAQNDNFVPNDPTAKLNLNGINHFVCYARGILEVTVKHNNNHPKVLGLGPRYSQAGTTDTVTLTVGPGDAVTLGAGQDLYVKYTHAGVVFLKDYVATP